MGGKKERNEMNEPSRKKKFNNYALSIKRERDVGGRVVCKKNVYNKIIY